jgi:hypothetical protein
MPIDQELPDLIWKNYIMNISPTNLVENACLLIWQFMKLSSINDIILVTMVSILAGSFVLPSWDYSQYGKVTGSCSTYNNDIYIK